MPSFNKGDRVIVSDSTDFYFGLLGIVGTLYTNGEIEQYRVNFDPASIATMGFAAELGTTVTFQESALTLWPGPVEGIPVAPLRDAQRIVKETKTLLDDFTIDFEKVKMLWQKAERYASSMISQQKNELSEEDRNKTVRSLAASYFHWRLRQEISLSLGGLILEALGEYVYPDLPPTALW